MKFLEKTLQKDTVKPGAPWGFVVYRIAYGDGTDEKWKRLVEMLRKEMEETVMSEEVHDERREELRQRHEMVLMDDREKFGGWTTHDVQKHFQAWVVD